MNDRLSTLLLPPPSRRVNYVTLSSVGLASSKIKALVSKSFSRNLPCSRAGPFNASIDLVDSSFLRMK